MFFFRFHREAISVCSGNAEKENVSLSKGRINMNNPSFHIPSDFFPARYFLHLYVYISYFDQAFIYFDFALDSSKKRFYFLSMNAEYILRGCVPSFQVRPFFYIFLWVSFQIRLSFLQVFLKHIRRIYIVRINLDDKVFAPLKSLPQGSFNYNATCSQECNKEVKWLSLPFSALKTASWTFRFIFMLNENLER